MKKLINLVHLFPLVRKDRIRSSLSGRDLDGFLPSKSQVIISTKDLDVKEGVRSQDTANIEAELSKPAPVDDSQRPR